MLGSRHGKGDVSLLILKVLKAGEGRNVLLQMPKCKSKCDIGENEEINSFMAANAVRMAEGAARKLPIRNGKAK